MNANLLPQTPAINDWLISASRQLSDAGITSYNLDAQIILAHAIGKDRTYLHAHPEQKIDPKLLETANYNLEKRIKRVPIAYIVGYKEFYGRVFIVDSSVLIPRPESETIIDLLKQILPTTTYHLPPTKFIDIGTGSGCLGITSKLEFPFLDVTLSDISDDALKVARKNAKKMSVNVSIVKNDLLSDISERYDIIVANLPYVGSNWSRSPETDYEPPLALFADNQGKSLIEKLIVQSNQSLTKNGYLIIESDPVQHTALIDFAAKHNLKPVSPIGYIICFKHQQ